MTLKRAITRSDMLKKYTKDEIRKMVKSGELKESYGKMAITGQIVRCYQWNR